MTRHEMRECIFCLMFQNDFYGTDEFEEQMSNFLANFHFPEEHEISEKDEKEVREKVERLMKKFRQMQRAGRLSELQKRN